MPQDKRLIVTKTIVNQLRKVCGDDEKAASEGVFLDFVVPPIVLQQSVGLADKIFLLPNSPFAVDGRTSVLIIPRAIGLDCSKINKRHRYFDAVIIAETICRRSDDEATKRAAQVAKTFSKFVVDKRIVSKLPPAIQKATTVLSDAKKSKVLVGIPNMEERESLGYALSQGSKGVQVTVTGHGLCSVRVGHGGMTSGDVSENAKVFISQLKEEYPHFIKFIGEFKIASSKTESVRYMEMSLSR